VLNVSDRNDGGCFTPADEMAVAEVADKIALVLDGSSHLPELRVAPSARLALDPADAPETSLVPEASLSATPIDREVEGALAGLDALDGPASSEDPRAADADAIPELRPPEHDEEGGG